MLYSFDDFTLDTDRFELRRGGGLVPVEPQVFELLRVLIEARDRVVSRDELFERIWQGRIVSDAALSSRVKAARRAVDDDGTAQRLIRTVHGRGFRFTGEVREAPPRRVDGAAVALTRDPTPPLATASAHTEALVDDLMQRPAVAVLPFADATADGGASYLADGLTDEVTAALCAWRCFPVISRHTAFRFRDSDLPTAEIGRATGARYLLSGTVLTSGERIKLTAALVDAEADRQLWSGRIVRALDEAFTLEEELAAQVVAMLEPEMETAEMNRILRKSAEDWTAWDLAMRALWCLHRGGDGAFDEAIRLAEAAAERSPTWYLPYALVAFVRFQRAMRSFSAADARTAFADTLAAAERALAIDHGSWLAHALTGVGQLWCHRHHDRALHHVHRAIQLNPSACWNYHFGGCITGFAGDPAAATRLQERIFRIDPAYPYTAVIESDLGLWSLVQGDLESAEHRLERAVAWDPRYGRAWQRRVALGGLKDDRDAAQSALRQLAELDIPLEREQLLASYPFREAAHRERFFDGFRRAGINL